jgi:hypothetical protein
MSIISILLSLESECHTQTITIYLETLSHYTTIIINRQQEDPKGQQYI